MGTLTEKFIEERTTLNQRALETANTNMKRFSALDNEASLPCRIAAKNLYWYYLNE